MKGTLHKTESGWHVINMQATLNGPLFQSLPLLPSDALGLFIQDTDSKNDGKEVEFEIVDFPSNSISKYAKLVDKATRPLAEDNALKTAMEQESKYSEKDIQNVLDGFTNEAPGQYIKTNFIELLKKQGK